MVPRLVADTGLESIAHTVHGMHFRGDLYYGVVSACFFEGDFRWGGFAIFN